MAKIGPGIWFFLIWFFSTVTLSCIDSGSNGSPPEADSSSPDSSQGSDSAVAPEGSTGEPYEIGTIQVTDLYISPTGNDSNAGTTLDRPLKTLTAAWNLLPETMTLTGYRINLLPGDYPCGENEASDCINYFSDKTGTRDYPVVIQSVNDAGGYTAGTALIRGGLDINQVKYLYLIGLRMAAGGQYPSNNSFNNVLHLAGADHVLMRELTLQGPAGRTDTSSTIQEVIKINQGTDIYLEGSDISGCFQTTLDYFSVQGGHILNSQIHGSGGRCAYLKGGTAYFQVEGNEFFDCLEAGFQAGEGSNLNLMRSPWLHYEAYDIKVVNNVLHNIYGAGLSVSGGYNILMAYNTLYKIGLMDNQGRGWVLAQFVHGSRGCAIVDEYPSEAQAEARCQEMIDEGAWGTADPASGGEWIPNRNIFVFNNIFYNPAGISTDSAHFAMNGPVDLPPDAKNIPDPARTDDNLIICGNIIFNGGSDLAFRTTTNGSEPACENTNQTCSESQLRSDNEINVFQPALTSPENGDFVPVAGGNIFSAPICVVSDFTWDSFLTNAQVPEGKLSNQVTENRLGEKRGDPDHPGAY